MRELKFRRWDTEYNRFFYIDFSYVKKVDFYDFFEYVDGPIEQYTGLKDKNGKEIYEGDVLEVLMKYKYYKGSTFKSLVRFENGCFSCCFEDDDDATFTIKVAGNIHENPELLSASQGVSK